MSQKTPRNKEKRSHSSSNEVNNSFVKNVTSRVSGLLPSTITKWFSSPRSSDANGSMPVADASDSSDDEIVESPEVPQQPPAKRMRFNSTGTYNHYSPPDASCSRNDVEIRELPYSPFTGTQCTQPTRNSYSTALRPPNEDHQDTMERDTPRFKMSHSFASTGQSVAAKRKSIFETTTPEEVRRATAKASTTASYRDPKQPSFKPSLLGSPFYPGRTMYGGAASSYINQPNIKQETVAVVNESPINDDSAISSAARRIMDLLESYSSPLMEARRIPLYTKPKNDRFLMGNTSSSSTNSNLAHRTRELHVPSIASILRLKKKSRLMDTTNIARQLMASQSSTSNEIPAYPNQETRGNDTQKEPPHKFSTKIKSRITRTNRGQQEEIDIATPVKLPTGTLQLDKDKLPQFTFDTPPPPPAAAKLTTSTPKIVFPTADKKATHIPTSKHETVISSVYTFSNPVKVSSYDLQVESSPLKFKFDSPERRIDQKFENKHDESSVVVGVIKANETISTKPKDWQCSDCWVKNKPESNKCVCCGAKQPIQNASAKCSVCKLADSQSQKDKCANCEKMSATQAGKANLQSIGASSTSKSLFSNASDSSSKFTLPTFTAVTEIPTNVFSKPETVTSPLNSVQNTTKVAADWKCDDCWISNKSSVDKCAACGGARPGAKQASTADSLSNKTTSFGTSDKFKAIAKTQHSDKWECSSCLVRNESDKKQCVCCGAEKEGIKKMPESKFNFGTVTNNTFKFGIDPKVQGASIADKPEVPSILDTKLKPQSEANNNVLAETPTFTFSLPTKKLENKVDTPKEKTDEAPKMNFTFGIPKTIPTVTTKLPETNKNSEEEKLQEVPSVDLNLPVQSKPQVPELTPVSKENKPLLPTTSLFNPLANTTKKDTSLKSAAALPEAADAQNPKPAFTFGLSSSTKLFEPPASTEKPKFQFTFGSNTTPATNPPAFKSPFGASESNVNTNTFNLSSGSSLGSSNNLATNSFGGSNGLNAPNGLTGNPMMGNTLSAMPGNSLPTNNLAMGNTCTLGGTNGLSANQQSTTMQAGNSLTGGATVLFNNTAPKENMWAASSNTSTPNLFVSNATTSSLQKPATFTFGSSTPFNAGNNAPAFGAGAAPPQNIFGMNNQSNNTQPNLFSSPVQSPPSGNLFGSTQPASNPTPQIPMFGSPSMGATSTFGSPTPSIPSFEAPSLNPAPAPAFSFGSPQPSATGIFGFGQQQPHMQQPQMQQQPLQQQSGVYSFGGAPAGTPQVQFNIGANGSNPAVRRVRKAVRRNPQR
ncbi:hypothetical protein HF086_004891 [Spodoptera exigua]|uniref:Nuclear pore complex protein Nup153 n=1 Tax=Spodoptera exigua TaxID=7107 RepID=A0A922MTC2_SPOEX|nr:hypothetical protein HF086_004891 [Spodoptera exigua]